MNDLVKLKWYHYHQNNSGGYYVEPARNVWVQGYSVKDIERRFEDIGASSEYCPCCGTRWSDPWDESDLTDVPEYYGEPLNQLEEPPPNVTNEKQIPFGLLVFVDGTQKILHTAD